MEGCVGEESFQLWELNRRLEAYLTRVKTLEEQNQLLSAELGGLRAQSGDASWRARADDELAALRVLVDQRWREKHEAEVQRDNLAEELEGVAGRCQQVRLARERTREEAACSRRALEAEKSAQGWLSTRVAELEREVEAVRAAHEEERAHLNAQAAAGASRRLPAPPRGPPAPVPEVEELARRLGEAWRGAVRDYQERVARMESSLGQARERLGRALRGAREGRLELQQLQAERDGLQERREALEQRLEDRWQDRLQATEKFQLAVEGLEQEKQGLQSQIAQILEGGQQLAHLKMSLSLEVATYRTLLEAENSRFQTPGRSSQASLGFQDPKLKLHFLGTADNQHLGSLLPVLSPTPLPSPLPDALETPVTAFLKTQEFLQARTPTLASTPIPPMPEVPCPTKVEVRAQDAPLSLLQTQGGRQQAPEPLRAEATASVSTGILTELEETGGKHPSHFPEDSTTSALSLNPHHPVLEAKDGNYNESRVPSIFQEDEGQIWELVEKEAAIEVKVESSLAQETQEDGLDMEEIQDSQGPLQKEILEALGQESLISLKIQSHETPGKENCNSLRSVDENQGTLKSPEEEKQTLLKSLEENDVEVEKIPEKGVPELSKPLGKEDPRIEDQELMSPEGTLETLSFIGKEDQEAVRSSEEANLESLTAFTKESQHPLGCPEEEDKLVEKLIENEGLQSLSSLEEEDQDTYRPLEKENGEPLKSVEEEDQRVERLIEKEGEESLSSLEEEDQDTYRPLEKENGEPLKSVEEGVQRVERLIEKEGEESLSSLEEENQRIVKPLERENQESLRSLDENQYTIMPLESKNQKPLKSLEVEEEQRIVKPLEKVSQDSIGSLEKENVDLLRSLEDNDQMTESLLKKWNQEYLGSHEDRNQETQDPQRFLEEEGQGIVEQLEKENQGFLGSLEEEQVVKRSLERENHEPLSSVEKDQMTESLLEKESQDSGKSLEEDQEAFRSLGKEDPDSLQSPKEQDQEIQRSLQQETQQTVWALGGEQMASKPPEKLGPELLKPLGNDQEIVRSLEEQNQESLVSLKETSVETVKSSEIENMEPLENAKEDLEIINSVEAQEPLWSAQVTGEATELLEKEIQESLGFVDGDQEILRPLARDNQELGCLETVESPEGVEEGRQHLELEACREMEEHEGSPRSLEEVEQELPGSGNQQRWEAMAVENAVVDQGPRALGRTGVESEDEAELPLSGQSEKEDDAEEKELQLDVMGEACSMGGSEPQEQGVPSEEGDRKGGAVTLQDLEGQPEQMGALEVLAAQGASEVTEPLLQHEDAVQAGEQDYIEVTLGSKAATAGLGLEQEVVGLGEPRHLAGEEAIHPSLGEESVEAKIAQDLEGPGKVPEEAGALASVISELSRTSSDALESKGCKESEPVVGWAVEEASVEASDHEGTDAPQPRPSETEGALSPPSPKLIEPCPPTPILEDAYELQPQAEGIQEAGWQLEGGCEAQGRVEDEQEFGLREIPEGLQDWEESREESEADELGETLPDSTPLGLYLRSPTSPKWGLAGEQRLSPQGEARKEGWGPAALASQGFSNPPGEEEQGRGSDLSSEEFEDLATEASLLPGVPKEVADHLGQAPPVPAPECWDQGGESDGFADEEESGEEGEEEEHEEEAESGAQWWGPGHSGGDFKVQHITKSGDLLEHESVGVSGLRGAAANISVTGLETESQDSTEPSGSEGSESVSSEGEDQVPDHLGAQGVTNMIPGAGDTFGVSGQGPSLESEHMNGKVENGLEQSEGQGVLDGHQDQGHSSQEQEASALKAPLVGSPVHRGPSQSLEFPLSGVDGDSWSSGED
ncbi:nestin isoform X2 [Phodopus roborovskii]|uniref:nestin isoform X2 n=1 Tax=Phodopus roborovskii TaxID=109678 RepID=UPI0021E39E90|nr:nestin isoform X2 [Phodopus roborovskii]